MANIKNTNNVSTNKLLVRSNDFNVLHVIT